MNLPLLTTVATWNNFFLPLAVLRDPGLLPVAVGTYSRQALSNAGVGGARAWNPIVMGSPISVVPLVAAFLALQKYCQSRLSAWKRAVTRTTQDDASRIQELTVSMP